MKKLLVILLVIAAVLGLLRTAGDVDFWNRYRMAWMDAGVEAQARVIEPRLKIEGVAGDALPRATAEAEQIAPEALAAATEAARQQAVRALIVHRHGHRVHEYFADSLTGGMQVVGGELAPAVMALAAGALVDSRRVSFDDAVQGIRDAAHPGESWRNPWSAGARHRFTLAAPPALLTADAEGTLAKTLSQRVWLPLGAADAWLWGRDDAALRLDCCIVARVDDWMRVGDLLLQQGSYEGERIVSPDWIRQLLAADPQGQRHPVWLAEQRPWVGDEPPAARETFWFDLGPDLRLWLVPRRGLSVLVWAGKDNARDTLLPNIILRGLLDQSPTIGGGELRDLVPGH